MHKIFIHEKTTQHIYWGHDVTPVWYVGPYLNNYRSIKYYIPVTEFIRITDTLKYIPKNFKSPKTTTEN